MDNPIISVVCTTYNQKHYISQCINSILMQKVNVIFELIVHDDASTDGTATIVKHYAEKYPQIIKAILQTENQLSKGISPLFDLAIPRCSGKYIAVCEADDYWIDPDKLQRQYEFLSENEEYVLSYGDYIAVDGEGRVLDSKLEKVKRFFRRQVSGSILRPLVKGNFIMTLTVLMNTQHVREALSRIHCDEKKVARIDYTLFLELSNIGKVKYDPIPVGAYRVLPESVSHSNRFDKRIAFIKRTLDISRWYNMKFRIGIEQEYFDRVELSAILKEYVMRRQYLSYWRALLNGVVKDPKNLFRARNIIYLLLSFIRSGDF